MTSSGSLLSSLSPWGEVDMMMTFEHFATNVQGPYSGYSELQAEISSDDTDRGLLLALVRSHTLPFLRCHTICYLP